MSGPHGATKRYFVGIEIRMVPLQPLRPLCSRGDPSPAVLYSHGDPCAVAVTPLQLLCPLHSCSDAFAGVVTPRQPLRPLCDRDEASAGALAPLQPLRPLCIYYDPSTAAVMPLQLR